MIKNTFLLNLIFIYFTVSITHAESLKCADFFKSTEIATNYDNQINSSQFDSIFKDLITNASNPYSISYDIKGVENHPEFLTELNALKKLLLQNNLHLKFEKLNSWVKSDSHALFLYDMFVQLGLKDFKNELNYLFQNNKFFAGSTPIHSSIESEGIQSLISYSFEKEGTSSDITLLYRDPKYTDSEWLQLSETDRLKLLTKIPIPKKTFINANIISPTELKPEYLGGYSQEMNVFNHGDYGWEVAHKKYEISRKRIINQIKDITKLFKESHSLHLHIVFEIPKRYLKFKNFIHWYKQLNDYLYLKGLEEGLHGNNLTGVANLTRDLSLYEKTISYLFKIFKPSQTIPESQWLLTQYSSKYFSAGLRALIYGKASSESFIKVGIELRDTTRNLENLDKSSDLISKSISDRVWEKTNINDILSHSFRLTNSESAAYAELLKYFPPKTARLLLKADPTVHFGLLNYENSQIYNYQTEKWITVSTEVKKRLQSSREIYLNELIGLEREIIKLEAQGQIVEIELIQAAIRMSLSSWAKLARPSELFSNL